MKKDEILENLESINNLPSMPAVVQKIQKLIASQQSNMSTIAAVIARDQAIATQVIRLVNSAFYGLRNKISSIQQAIVILGLNTVKNLVTGVSIVRAFTNPGGVSLFDRDKFWFHTFGCAMGAKSIAQAMKKDEPEDYFLAGLLHDVGILVLDQFFHEDFTEVIKHSISNGKDYINAENDILGITHCEIGQFLALKWDMPESLIHTVRYHHDPQSTPSEVTNSLDVISVVHIADIASQNAGIHMGIRNRTQQFAPGVLKRIGIKETEIDRCFETVNNEVKELVKEWRV